MRIALDGGPLTVPTGGIRRYTEALACALRDQGESVCLVADQPLLDPPAVPADARPRHGLHRRWWLWGLPRTLHRLDAAVFHGTDFSVPYLPLRPSVVTIHDLSPWNTAWQAAAGRIRRRTPLLLQLGIATMVITPSEPVRQEVLDCFGLSPARVAAVPLAAADRFRPVSAPAADYFLFVGTNDPRKNLTTAIAAWEAFGPQRPPLWIAGRQRPDSPPLPDHPGLRLLGAVPDEALPALYSGALAVLYPSRYEGFGLPVLEAMQCGAPVLASTDPAVAATAGGAALLLPPDDVASWRDAMLALAAQPDLRRTWRDRGLHRAAQFSWARTARLTRAVYQEACDRFGR